MDVPVESSDTDSSTTSSFRRLGNCEVCNANEAKYTCPKCEVKTCCLQCLNIHKKELNCDGIRDRTKFVPVKKMTNMDYMSDYYFLEECTRFVDNRKRDKLKQFTRYNKSLPTHLYRLRAAARKRNIYLRFLLQNFSKHNENTTYFNWKDKVIYWRIEWLFPNAGNLKFVDDRCSEGDTLSKLLAKYLDITNINNSGTKALQCYAARGLGGIKVLLKSEGIKNCKNRFFELDVKKTLNENLAGKTLVEYPTILVIYSELVNEFNIIGSDEDVEAEAKIYCEKLDSLSRPKSDSVFKPAEELEKELEQLKIKKKREERRKRREDRARGPQNYLFSNESMWTDSSDSSDKSDGNVTEEDVISPKRSKGEAFKV